MIVLVGDRIGMKHGAGGRAMRRLIDNVFLRGQGPIAQAADDGAVIPVGEQSLIVTTDSHVIHPIVFPGGDIGRLAIAGTVNDLAMMGAVEPLGITCAVVVEEGFAIEELSSLQQSMVDTCVEAGTTIVAGDTKVMRRGELDGIVINTTGVGLVRRPVRDGGALAGDAVIVTGTIGDHGMAIMAARNQFQFADVLASDVAPLNGLIAAALAAGGDAVHAMKDPTRGGVASALHEIAAKSHIEILLAESSVPVRAGVRAAADLLGIDPLFVANEGKALLVVHPLRVEDVLQALRSHPYGREATVIGYCAQGTPGNVLVDTGFGRRLLSEPDGELLPRIC